MFAGLPPSSSDLTERKSVVPPSPPADRRREHRESAAVVVVRRGRTPPLTPPPCVGARFPTLAAGFFGSCSRIALCLIARSARGDVRWVAAVFVGSVGTEKRCSAISSCRSAARTSLIDQT